MAKKKGISSTDQLAAYRRKLRRKATGWGIGWFAIIIVVYFLYCFLAIAPQGYAGQPAFSWAADWKFTLPYFDTTNSILTLSDSQVIYRWVVLLAVVVVAIAALFAVRALLISSYRAKAISAHDSALGNLLKEQYGISASVIPGKGFADEDDVISATNVDTATKDYTVILSDQVISFDASQYTYIVDGLQYEGVVAVTELVSSKVEGFIQFRSFGAPESRVVNDKTVYQYNIWDERLEGEFTVFSTMTKEEVMAFASEEFISRLVKLRKLVSGGLVVTIQNSTLSVLLDGMSLKIGKSLRETLPTQYLERQGRAVKALFDIFEGFVKDSTFTVEEKQIPLVQPLGQQAPLPEGGAA